MIAAKYLPIFKRLVRIALFVLPLLAPGALQDVRASEEGVIALSSFMFQGADSDNRPIAISGTQTAVGITALDIKAFGRDIKLTKARLENLKGMIINGVQLSAEGGYPSLAGRTLYLRLSMGFMSGTASGKLVVVNERGDVTFQPIKNTGDR